MPFSRSLATDCGVEMTMSEALTASALLLGDMVPLTEVTEKPGSIPEKYVQCWSTRGLVGASMSTFFPEVSTCAATLAATAVFPRPVGRITRELSPRHPSAIVLW